MNFLKRTWQTIQNKKRVKQEVELLHNSELFDSLWYSEQHADLASWTSDIGLHYLIHGAAEGRNPSPLFDTKFYLENNPDVALAGVNPLVHYITVGHKEQRRAKGLAFDADFYTALYPEVLKSGLSPVEHFQCIGKLKFYHPAFDEEWYRIEYLDVTNNSGSLREHFLIHGKHQGRHPAFHPEWYSHEYPDVASSGLDPLSHYRRFGRREGRHASFDRNFYLEEYKDIGASDLDPFEHYNEHGRREGRFPAFNRAWYCAAYKDIGNSDLDPYEHYKRAGRAEGRPLSPPDMMKIAKWGLPNAHSVTNSPWKLEGGTPARDPEFSPKVSVIVPNYNHAQFLPKRLESIYSQTYRNFEVILLDDASSDHSVEVLKGYAERYPEQTTCAFNDINSGGVFNQWKRGLELANGELIWIAESDDFCSPDFLAELVRFFRNNGVMLAFCRTDFVTDEAAERIWTSEAYWAEVGFDLGTEPIIMSAHEIVRSAWGARNLAANVSGVLFRNPGKLPIFDDPEWLNLRMCGDWVFYLSLIRGGLIGYSPAVTNFYRQHPQNTSISTHDKDLYYSEHETVAKYLVRLYDVCEDVVRGHQEVLYRHWVMKRGLDRRGEFEKLFDIEKVIAERAKRKPNIAIATYALVTGGGETFPILVANQLLARGFAVTVLNFEAETTNAGIRATLAPAIPIVEPGHSMDAGRILAKLGAELVHSHHAWVDITLALALKNYPSIRHIATMHGLYEMLDRNWVLSSENDLASIDSFVYIADKNLLNFSNHFKRRQRFRKITNTISLAPLSNLTRQDQRIAPTDFLVCLASRAVPEKGWDEAIQAVIQANKRSNRTIRLLLVGDGPEYERLREQPLPDFIHLLGFRKNVRDLFALSDVGLIASKFRGESCPLVLIECLSVGKPVIASNIGEVRSMLATPDGPAGVVHNLNAWSIDISALAEIIERLADDPTEYERLRSRAPAAMAKFNQDMVIGEYLDEYHEVLSGRIPIRSDRIRLSVVVVAYDMAREVQRTIFTMSPDYQQLPCSDYEVILIDNGSNCDYDVNNLHSICPNLTFIRIEQAKQSPVEALNYGISIARGGVICACIDAARMASPNLLKTGLAACEADYRTVAGALSFHLGLVPQNASVRNGYNQSAEDKLLETVNWRANGYELYRISAFDPSSRFGLYNCPAETNALFMSRELWTKCGGFDARFSSKGGGLTNLDIWARLCESEDNVIVTLLGEGTFHQFHGGVATNAIEDDVWTEMHEEYVRVRGVDFRLPARTPLLFGSLNPWILEFEKRVNATP